MADDDLDDPLFDHPSTRPKEDACRPFRDAFGFCWLHFAKSERVKCPRDRQQADSVHAGIYRTREYRNAIKSARADNPLWREAARAQGQG